MLPLGTWAPRMQRHWAEYLTSWALCLAVCGPSDLLQLSIPMNTHSPLGLPKNWQQERTLEDHGLCQVTKRSSDFVHTSALSGGTRDSPSPPLQECPSMLSMAATAWWSLPVPFQPLAKKLHHLLVQHSQQWTPLSGEKSASHPPGAGRTPFTWEIYLINRTSWHISGGLPWAPTIHISDARDYTKIYNPEFESKVVVRIHSAFYL